MSWTYFLSVVIYEGVLNPYMKNKEFEQEPLCKKRRKRQKAKCDRPTDMHVTKNIASLAVDAIKISDCAGEGMRLSRIVHVPHIICYIFRS